MQRLEYRTHIATTIFVGVLGVALLALCVGLIVNGTMSESGRAGEIIIGYVLLPLALFFLVGALRPGAMAADDTGLRLRRTFGTQRIPWAAIQGFRMVSLGRSGPNAA